MKKIVLSLIAISTIAFSAEFYDLHGTESVSLVQNQTIVNTIIADTPQTDLITTKKDYGATAQFVYSENVNILNIPLGMQIGSGFGIEAYVPIIDTPNDTGIGDISIGGNYNFGSVFDSTGVNITSLLYKTTTGDETKGLGSGKGAVTLSHKIAKNLSEKYTLNGSLSYTLNDDTISGDSYMAMIGASMPCLISNQVRTSAKLTYFAVEDYTNQWGWTSGEVNSADLWLQWDSTTLVNNLPLGFGVKIPLLNEMDGNDADKTLLFYLSVTSFF